MLRVRICKACGRPRGTCRATSLSPGAAGLITYEPLGRRLRRPIIGGFTMSTGKSILSAIRQHLNLTDYRKTHWEGSLEEYLDIVLQHPEVTRTAYQRLYDMILSHGTEEVYEHKDKVVRFRFFTEYATQHGDPIYGLDRQLMHLVND